MKLLVINGPNINMLGIREPDIYGRADYASLLRMIAEWSETRGVYVECFQSNHEGEIVDRIQQALGTFDGIVINPAAYTHTSVAILDAPKAAAIPAAEVHISDISEREDFRQISYAGMACSGHFIGRGLRGYTDALEYLKQILS